MSFWTWVTSDEPGDVIVDEKWDGRMEKLADKTVELIEHLEDMADFIIAGITGNDEEEE